MTEPTTEAGRRLLAEYPVPSDAADPTEEWVADGWAAANDRAEAIAAIEREAAENEHRRLAHLGAEHTTPEKQAQALRKWNPEIVAAIEREAIAATQRIDVERLARAYDNLVLRDGKGDLTSPLGAYVLTLAAQLAAEYDRLGAEEEPRSGGPA